VSIISKAKEERRRRARVLQFRAKDGQDFIKVLKRQFDAMPGPAEEKYLVALRCKDGGVYHYPIYQCKDGFTAALKDAILKHQEENRPTVDGGMVQGCGTTTFDPPDSIVQLIAAGGEVIAVNKLHNNPSGPPKVMDGAHRHCAIREDLENAS
jgi:hypothetical protein